MLKSSMGMAKNNAEKREHEIILFYNWNDNRLLILVGDD